MSDDLLDLPSHALVTIPAGLVGIPGAVRFRLRPWGDDDGPFGLLESLDDPTLSFVVVDPDRFFDDYEPEIGPDVAEALGLRDADDAQLLVIVTVGDPVGASSANLLGPLVVHRRSGLAAQAVLSPEHHDPRRPLFARSGSEASCSS